MASLSLPTQVDERLPQPTSPGASAQEVLLVVDLRNPAAADYVSYACGQGNSSVTFVADRQICNQVRGAACLCPLDGFSRSALEAPNTGVRAPALVLFLGPRLEQRDRKVLDELLGFAGERKAEWVCIVSSFAVHLGDDSAAKTEAEVLAKVKKLSARTVVFRPGHIVSPNSRAGVYLRRLGSFYPLVPGRFKSCCVDGDELFAAIESERRDSRRRRSGLYTLLGPNRPWRAMLAQHRGAGLAQACLTALSFLLSFLLIGQFGGLVYDLFLKRWNLDTLRPRSFRDLLALYNKYNYRHVKVVGYNNGVVHFGQKFPGKTVVSTVHCNRVVRAGPDAIKADSGATIRKALDFLAGADRTLYVIPNYSYVCMGTSFFVPIHGSAADFSAVAETITKVILYDPVSDRLIVARRDQPAFREHVYNLGSDVLLLRLYVRVKPKSRYYVHRQEVDDPGSGQLLEALRDGRASNVEIRQSHASSSKVQICKYYNDPGDAESPVLELPRDSLGRLWDKLEENAVTSFLFHALVRNLAWHVELFFTAEEFARFWESHRTLPLRKIQLRYLRRDGFPHSPLGGNDCVSADLFMLRRDRRKFEAYLKQTFATVRSNPGKHSR
jgi:hypothetical protein